MLEPAPPVPSPADPILFHSPQSFLFALAFSLAFPMLWVSTPRAQYY